MKIERKRWVIMPYNRTEIFCGLAKNYEFKPVDEIGNTAIKTYRSRFTALSGFKKSWHSLDFEVEAVEIRETYESVQD